MNRKQLFTKLNKLCLALDNEYNINNGGCCYVAACIAEQLERFNIPFKVIHYGWYSCHYAIKVSDRYINRDNYTKREICEILDYGSMKLYNLYYSETWNIRYNIDNNNIVHNKVKELFDENNGT